MIQKGAGQFDALLERPILVRIGTLTGQAAALGSLCYLDPIGSGDAQVGDESEDGEQEDRAGRHRTQTETAVLVALREIVTDGCSEGPCKDVGDPECQNRVHLQPEVREGDDPDKGSEDD